MQPFHSETTEAVMAAAETPNHKPLGTGQSCSRAAIALVLGGGSEAWRCKEPPRVIDIPEGWGGVGLWAQPRTRPSAAWHRPSLSGPELP